MKNKTLGSTRVDTLNCIDLNVVDIYFASDSWTVLRMRVTHSIIEIIGISKPLWFFNNIHDFKQIKMIRTDA